MLEVNQQVIDNRRQQERRGYAFLRRMKELIVGAGDTVFRADTRGIWLGAKNFEDAPFRVDMQGNIVASSLTTDALQEVKDGITVLSDLKDDLGTITAGTVTGATVQTASTGLRLRMSGDNNSYEFLSGNTLLAELKSTTVPNSGTSGAAVRHGTGLVMLEVSGSGEGVGDRYAVLTNSDASVFIGIYDDDSAGAYYILTGGLPTSDPGIAGALWNDSGTMKISAG